MSEVLDDYIQISVEAVGGLDTAEGQEMLRLLTAAKVSQPAEAPEAQPTLPDAATALPAPAAAIPAPNGQDSLDSFFDELFAQRDTPA